MIVNILLFLFFALVGWILDSTFSSITQRKFVFAGYYKNLPICPIYGFGGLLMTNIFIQLEDLHPFYTILIATLAVTLLEYFGGWFCDKILKERLWDYSKMKFNLNGYISLTFTFYWLILTTIVYIVFTHFLPQIQSIISGLKEFFSPYDIYFTVAFLIAAYALTVSTRDRRLKEYSLRYHRGVAQVKQQIRKIETKLKTLLQDEAIFEQKIKSIENQNFPDVFKGASDLYQQNLTRLSEIIDSLAKVVKELLNGNSKD